jgi:hypothetical protein
MTKHEALIRRLCEASEGSAELSVEVWDALTPHTHIAHTHVDHNVFATVARYVGDGDLMGVECLTISLSAAWEEAERRGYYTLIDTLARGDGREYEVSLFLPDPSDFAPKGVALAGTPALGIAAALLAAEGER